MILNLVYVALGGAVGACLRYLTGLGALRLFGPGFPLGVITVNIFGSLVMGILAVYLAKRGLMQFSPLLMTGLLGGFTTFSAFSLEAVTLYERGQASAAAAYVLISVVGALMALIVGLWIARGIWA
ncbi:fluoride efflux transporter CrcB [Cognatishimia sp. SS12]|uniref:fluoride efflux transporter CrcB n=1 Tax=Cognatishimia sp. SS12 TaxID=2979465 RepID=UPI0023303A62|nr:fluoride efflux transporter CrcB [Cognatishimia sp. SS12]MDC0738349.1 fluoride efflux transporter CrcB [Cognatishimia sp. SS12]